MRRRIAVVTGGGGDIGADICKALRFHNYYVISLDVVDGPQSSESRKCDITDVDEVWEYLCDTEADVLVNVAGITRDAFFHKMTPAEWHKVINVNLHGMYNVTNVLYPGMREREYGRIVNIGSVNGCKGQFGQCNYAASKAAVHGFTMSLAQEGARKNIMVNTISPGYIDTQMTQKLSDEVRNGIIDTIPVKHMGKPSDVTRTVMFLVDESNTYVTGANIPVNGGLFTSF